jgi:hypothetical protein
MSCEHVRQAWSRPAPTPYWSPTSSATQPSTPAPGLATNPESARHYNLYRYDYGGYSQGATLSAKRTVKLWSDIV